METSQKRINAAVLHNLIQPTTSNNGEHSLCKTENTEAQ